jgi:ureidoglycolate amidohydrolase
MRLAIDTARVTAELEILAAFSEVPSPAVTRVVFSDADLRARQYVKSLCAAAGLALREDAVGNTFARWGGSDEHLPAVGTGSHIDAIPHAGRYDGTVGVLGGLEAIRALQAARFRPRRSVELLVFTAEEPTRFGIGCLGSRLLAGLLDEAADDALKDKSGTTLRELRGTAGFRGGLSSVRLPQNYYAGFIELHIEQGPLLEREQIPIGVVTSIAAPASLRIVCEGEGGHAGAMLMSDRHDAFLAAAEIALALEGAVKATGAVDTVGTAGVCDVFPGAINSVPARVKLELDLRDTDQPRRDGVLQKLSMACDEISRRRGVSIRRELLNADPPAQSAPEIVEALRRACACHRIAHKTMVSRAYHDSLFIARVAPMAMLFIPCRGGVSHRPDEYASPEAIAQGILVLAETLRMLAG